MSQKERKQLSPIRRLLTDFLEYCEIEKNHSQLTIRNYDHYLNSFLDFSDIRKPEQITLDLVRKYRIFLNRVTDAKGRSLKKVTQNYYIIAIRSFLKYLSKRDIKTLAPEKIELADIPERIVEFLEDEELERLMNAAHPKTGRATELRDRAILETLFSTGLRISELTKLNRDSINLSKDEFTVRGKGDKPRVVFLSPAAKKWLKASLDKRKDSFAPLFINSKKQKKEDVADPNTRRLTPRSVQRIVQKYAKIAGITKKVTPHTLRHSYATDLLINGADIRSVQSMLGHASITTTQIYTHITNKQLREVHQAFHGKKRKK